MTAAATPVLSIIVVSWNVSGLLRTCLASMASRRDRLDVQVIVVDNASADDSVAMVSAEFPWVELIASPDNLGFARGCERGYTMATADLILLLNPDTVVVGDAIEAMADRFAADDQLGILGSCLLNGDGSFQRATGGSFPTLANLAWNYLFFNRVLPASWAPAPLYLEAAPTAFGDIDWVSGASLMFRRATVGATIFDPEIFMFGEDMELCHRVAAAGWRVRLSHTTRIIHFHGQSFKQQNSAAILGSVYKGPRLFFSRTHGRVSTALYDSILFVGYFVRWPIYAVANVVRPGRGYDELSRFSRRYLGVMLQSMAEPR